MLSQSVSQQVRFFFFLLTNWQADLKIYMEMKKTENGQNNVEKKEDL